ncbi:hypothetical protein MO973_12075 [Paenibacillus sp. TRM 82003]|nr:hypothetical protein [Paenibacillus sp. TRM 82003]
MHGTELPPLLAGPIVRRAEPSRVVLWVATAERCRIESTLYEGSRERGSLTLSGLLPHETKQRTVRLGERLFVALLELRPPKGGTFPTRTFIGYDLRFVSENDSGRTFGLSELGLLDASREDSIVYGDFPLPVFRLQGAAEAPMLHGSCRKPHGAGDDALAAADAWMEANAADDTSRPGALFLMGDQIYADDVADPLSPAISFLAERLTGRAGEWASVDDRLRAEPFASAIRRMQGRQYVSERLAKFTSSTAANHLFDFGEYAAMYLLAWSPQLWAFAREQGAFASYDEHLQAGRVHFVFPDERESKAQRAAEARKHRARYEAQEAELRRFERTVPRVRRLLANVPTYMAFDDHDVTDDWNLSAEWKDDVSRSPLGRWIVANALSAYWAFQGWGNEPEAFDEPFARAMEARFEGLAEPGSPAYEAWAERLWRFDNWHYVAPTTPKTVVLDTRTMRGYDPDPLPTRAFGRIAENRRSPRLLHRFGWQLLAKKLLESGWAPGEPLLLVSPAPLYGIGLIETLLHRWVYPLRAFGLPVHQTLDFEVWKYNSRGFFDMLEWLAAMNPAYCIVLSGDVHSASAVSADAEAIFAERTIPIRQLTSSPLCNESFGGVVGFLMKRMIDWNAWRRKGTRLLRYGTEDHRFRRGKTPDDVRWKESIRYVPKANGSIIELGNNIGLLSVRGDEVRQSLIRPGDGRFDTIELEPIPLDKVQ